MKRHIAEIIDNNDTDQEGKCQIYIEHLHHDLNVDQYPWARQDRELTSNIPEVGEYVWVYFLEDRYHRKAYYQNKVTLKEYHEHNETIGSLSGSYPNIKYIKVANGCSLAFNSDADNPEITIYHPSAEIYIDSNGYITVEDGASNKIEMNASGIQITGGNSLTVNGNGTPNSLGCFLGVKNCIFSGAPISTNKIEGI